MKILNFALLLSVVGCSQSPKFDYKLNDKPAEPAAPIKVVPHIEFDHKVKELSGFGSADLLWIIDNSASMQTYQNEVIANMDTFMKAFLTYKLMSWKMGLISTDYSEGPYLGFEPGDLLDETTPNPVLKFNRAVNNLGTNGDGTERVFEPVKKVLENYPNFLRPTAALFIIMITDAKEQSSMTANSFISFLTTIKGNINKVISFGVLQDADQGCSGGSGEEPFSFLNSKYDQFMKKTRGTNFLICSPDYGKSLSTMANTIGNMVERPKMILKSNPKPETIRITYKGVELAPGDKADGGYWFYDFMSNAIWFHDLTVFADINAEVHVSYVEIGN